MKPLLHASLLAAAILLANPARADTLIDHVNGITLDAQGQIEHFTGLVTDRDGRVAALLHEGDPRPRQPDYALDGKGAVLLPGMIDAHAHVMMTGLATMTLDLSATHSLDEALHKIADWAATHPYGWIIGQGWNQEAWQLGRFPTAADLDAVVPDRPVWLARADGHAGWANSRALALAGISAATHAPADGRIERLPPPKPAPKSLGKPAGVLVDGAQALVAHIVPKPRPEDLDEALATASTLFLSHGVTTVADMGTSIADWQAFRRAGDAGTLRLRIMAYGDGIDAMALIGGPGPTPWLYNDRLRLNGVKLVIDGALASRGAALKAPYSDAPGSKGMAFLTETQLKNLMARAAMDHFQIAVDAIGDAANTEMLNAVEEVTETFKGDRRWRIEHAQIVDPADMPRFGNNGIVASMQPTHQTSDRLMAEARLGPARLAGACAWASMLKAGAHLAFGSDTPEERPDPFAGLAAAISRQDPDDEPTGGWQPPERITREQALAAYTIGAAWAGFAEGRFGQLLPGQRADFILVDTDPLTASPAAIAHTRVLQSWVGGRLMWQAEK